MKTYTMVIYFTGRGEPIGHAQGVVRSRADGIVIASTDESALDEEGVLQLPTKRAQFDTVVTVIGDTTYESGKVYFPGIDSDLTVETSVPGKIISHLDGYATGSITWRVLDGSGLFKGATGTVTGNFLGNPDDTFTDHQVFKLILPN
jgi:hypothetical protein